MTSRRLLPTWQVQTPGGFKVLDANGQALVYVYARETKAEADISKVLTFVRLACSGKCATPWSFVKRM
jgi:hypothetical protein